MQQRRQHLCRLRPILCVVAVQRDLTRLVVIAQKARPPAIFCAQFFIRLVDRTAHVCRRPGTDLFFRRDERDGHTEFAARSSRIVGIIRKDVAIDLTDRHQMLRRTGSLDHFVDIAVRSWQIDAGSSANAAIRRLCFAQPFVQIADRIHTEAIHPFVHPPANDVVDLFADAGIIPIEIRLLLGKQVQIILPARRDILPRAAAKNRFPLVRRRSVGIWIPPDVIIAVRAGTRLTGGPEPGMLVGAVIQDQIHNHSNPAAMAFRRKAVPIFHGPKFRHNCPIIRDIIPIVHIGRRVDRREPDGIYAEVRKIVEPAPNAFQIANTVAVRVLKAAGIDLVNDKVLEPVFCMDQLNSSSLCRHSMQPFWSPTQ